MPLVLVSAQRVDQIARRPVPSAAVVRPRRVTGGLMTAPAQQSAPSAVSMPHPAESTDTQVAERPAAASLRSVAAPDAQMMFETDDEPFALTGSSSVPQDAADFIDFAERVGAARLTEVMEAAAAYVACIEKRDQFTRPQLMRRLEGVTSVEGFSREEGLISFGTLLRQGRLAKVRRGQYTISEDSDYLIEARRHSK